MYQSVSGWLDPDETGRIWCPSVRINPTALRVIRERTGLTQTAVAHAAGIARPNYSFLEAGKRKGTGEQIRRIADVLRVPISAIAYLHPDEQPAKEDAA